MSVTLLIYKVNIYCLTTICKKSLETVIKTKQNTLPPPKVCKRREDLDMYTNTKIQQKIVAIIRDKAKSSGSSD